jgi:hypothetical protein
MPLHIALSVGMLSPACAGLSRVSEPCRTHHTSTHLYVCLVVWRTAERLMQLLILLVRVVRSCSWSGLVSVQRDWAV